MPPGAHSVTAGHVTTARPSAPRERFGRLLGLPKATQKELGPKRNVRPYAEPPHNPLLKLSCTTLNLNQHDI